MKQIRQKLIFALTFVIIFAALMGFKINNKITANPKSEVIPKSEPVELQFWDMAWGSKDYIKAAMKLVDKYNKQNSNVIVKYQSIPWQDSLKTFLIAIASGTAPDISTGYAYQAFQFYKRGVILPIDDVIEELRSSGKDRYFSEGLIEQLKYDNHYIALPWQQEIMAVWYRKDLFVTARVEPPNNWNELREVSKKLTNKDVYAFSPGGAMKNGTQFLYAFMINNGGAIFDEYKNVAVNSLRNQETFKFLSDLVKDGTINPEAAGFSNDDAEQAFVSGRAAMYVSNADIEKTHQELSGRIGVLEPMEGLHGDKGTVFWRNNIMIFKGTEHQKETKEFLKWWSENNKSLFVDGKLSYIPSRKDFAKDPYFTEDVNINEIVNLYMPIGRTNAGKSDSIYPEMNEIESGPLVIKAVQDIITKKDINLILQHLQRGIEEIIK